MELTARHLRNDAGVTLVELGVTMVIVSLIGLAALGLLSSALRGDDITSDDSEALAQLRVSTERLTKEIRQARLIYATSDATTVTFWVDYDRDNQQDAEEQISWAVEDLGGGEARLVRYTAADPTPAPVAADFLTGDAFVYEPALPGTPTVVNITLRADLKPGAFPGERIIDTSIRIRNEAT